MAPEVRGYPIDFRLKTERPVWPPEWLEPQGPRVWVTVDQWGLGAYERYLCDEGEEWLAAAIAVGEYLLERQTKAGELAGGWPHAFAMPHTYRLDAGWLSAMAQGEGASLLVRLSKETGRAEFAEGAELALRPMRVPSARGGVGGELGGAFFPEEYPSIPGSFVLNGSVFALWGCDDVAKALGSDLGGSLFEEGLATLVANLGRWDLGYWSAYDLFPHPVVNVASSAYHHLHVMLLRALERTAGVQALGATASRFERYAQSRRNVARATFQKALFRLLVPRNRLLANRLPWSHRPPA